MTPTPLDSVRALAVALLLCAALQPACTFKSLPAKTSPDTSLARSDGSIDDPGTPRRDGGVETAPADVTLVDQAGDSPLPADRKALGSACTQGEDCEAGFCVDGLCCDSACTGTCVACDRAGAQGTCGPVMGAPRGSRPACLGAGTACGGQCDGSNGDRCTYPGGGTECAPGACAAGIATTASVCNGAGTCLPGTDVSCAPFTCDGAICAGGCAASRPCVAGNYCDGGRCFPLVAAGAPCKTAQQCATGSCVDGVCCSKPACGACETCGSGGACTKIVDKDDPGTCSGARTCSHSGQCRKRAGEPCKEEDECGSSFCVSSRCCTVATCGACASCTGPGGSCVKLGVGSTWEKVAGSASDIDVGPDGSVWAIGTNVVAGGHGIFHWTGAAWENPPGGAVRIAVGPRGIPWVVNDVGNIFRWTGGGWEVMPGLATDIDVGADGSVWVLGVGPVAGGFGIYRWTGTTWINVPGGATRIAVGPTGVPWVVNSGGVIFRRVGEGWEALTGAGTNIDIGADGNVWLIGVAAAANKGIFRWNGAGWDNIPGGAVGIGAGPCLPWVVNAGGEVFRRI
jgi:hypothetical protein